MHHISQVVGKVAVVNNSNAWADYFLQSADRCTIQYPNKYFLSTYCVPETVLDTEVISVSKTDQKIPNLRELTS